MAISVYEAVGTIHLEQSTRPVRPCTALRLVCVLVDLHVTRDVSSIAMNSTPFINYEHNVC